MTPFVLVADFLLFDEVELDPPLLPFKVDRLNLEMLFFFASFLEISS